MSTLRKPASTSFPIHELLAERWSPLAFDARPVSQEDLGSLFEAARWAASCFNEQPWSFVVASQEQAEDFARLAACIVPANAAWAAKAPVLMLSLARKTFTRNGKANRFAGHDTGLAVGNMCAQAQHLGLVMHQMGGFDADKARIDLAIPEDYEPMAMIALGYQAASESLPEDMAAREGQPRERRALETFVFGGGFGGSIA